MVFNATFNYISLVVIGTDCTGSCNFNNHAITTTMATLKIQILYVSSMGNHVKRDMNMHNRLS
jgi:hypothetical protein